MVSMTVKTWLSVSMTRSDRGGQAMTSSCLVATAYFAHSARLLAHTARVLEENDGAERYHALADSIRDAFLGRFHAGGGQLTEETQTAYALALWSGAVTRPATKAPPARNTAAETAPRMRDAEGMAHLAAWRGCASSGCRFQAGDAAQPGS
ncbi:hypothetical protein [Streptomyces sp. NPDC058252]|uniref:alpha-L-rhamnosidase-related protein n=1 Tax=Streptomyces sp. NPDC058252 TaxID=3346405 RepID=UPI0036ED1EAA